MGYEVEHPDLGKMWMADHSDGLDTRCGGSGILNCHCGGDLCVCGNFGEVYCEGCSDCEFEDFEGEVD